MAVDVSSEPDSGQDPQKIYKTSSSMTRFYVSNEFGLIVIIVLFGAMFGLLTDGFLSNFSLFTLGRTAAINMMIGMSMMVVIATGGLNLALGAIGVSAAMAFGFFIQIAGIPWPLAVILSLATGAALGFVNGWVVVRSGLHSFIITLATMSIFFGAMIFLTHAESYREIPAEFSQLGRMKIFKIISPLLILTLIIALALAWLYRLTSLGREMLASGANANAAELSGISVGRVFIYCHMLSGLIAAIAALMLTARNGAAIPSMAGQLGQDWLLTAFLGPVLGGCLLNGGRVSVLGTCLGAFLVTMLTTGLLMMQVGEFWIQSFLGLLLLLAVLIDLARRRLLARGNFA